MLFGCELQSLRDLTDISRGFHGSISLSMKIRMGLTEKGRDNELNSRLFISIFLGKNRLSKRPREFCLFTKGFYSFAVSYTLSYPQTMRNSNCHSMEAIIIIECIVQDRKWKSNKVPILIFSTLNSFWVNKWHMNGEIPH